LLKEQIERFRQLLNEPIHKKQTTVDIVRLPLVSNLNSINMLMKFSYYTQTE
jgi:hypothetical protein